jgi:mRNA-degrading endonuclease RelE of RelBE toxin-antitoxin system
MEKIMLHPIYADLSASVTDLKKNPMKILAAGEGSPVAILNRNEPVFYCVPAKSGQTDRYKIKLRTVGYRLVYEVKESEILVLVIAVGRKDKKRNL